MSLKDYKITDVTAQNVYVQSQPDILNGTTQENKAAFDAYPALIKDRFNAVLEILGGDSAASEMLIQTIEGLTAGNVQQALAEMKRLLDAYIAKIKSTAGAAEVGVRTISGMSAQNAQEALSELKTLIDNLVIGVLPPGSVTTDMIADGAVTTDKCAFTAADLGAVDADTVGQPGGVASLGLDGKLDPAQAPDTGAVMPVTGVPETVEHNRIAVDEAGVAYTGTTASAPVMQYSTANITISDAEPAETLPEGHIWMVYS